MKYRFLVIVLAVLLTSTLSYGQTKTYNSIRQVDFLNFVFPLTPCFENQPEKISVKNGRFETKDILGCTVWVVEKKILYTDFAADNINEAVVPVMCGCGNWANVEIFVYTLRNGKPEVFTKLRENIFERDYKRYYPGSSLWGQPFKGEPQLIDLN